MISNQKALDVDHYENTVSFSNTVRFILGPVIVLFSRNQTPINHLCVNKTSYVDYITQS